MNELQKIYSIQNKIDELELLLFLPKEITLTNIQKGGADSDILLGQLCGAKITNGTVLYDKYGNSNLQVRIKNNLVNKAKAKFNANCNYFAKGSLTVVYIVSINDDPNEYILRVNYQNNRFDYDKYVKDSMLGIKKYLPKYLYYGPLHFNDQEAFYTIGRKYKRVEDASFDKIINKITFINNLIDLLTIMEDLEPKDQWIINDLKSSNIAIGDDFMPIIIDYDNSTIGTRVHTYSFTIFKDKKYEGSKSMADGFVEIFIKVFFGEDLFGLSKIFNNSMKNDKIERCHRNNYKDIKEYFDGQLNKLQISDTNIGNINKDKLKNVIQNWCNKIINYENNIYTGLWSYYPIQFKEFKLQQKK